MGSSAHKLLFPRELPPGHPARQAIPRYSIPETRRRLEAASKGEARLGMSNQEWAAFFQRKDDERQKQEQQNASYSHDQYDNNGGGWGYQQQQQQQGPRYENRPQGGYQNDGYNQSQQASYPPPRSEQNQGIRNDGYNSRPQDARYSDQYQNGPPMDNGFDQGGYGQQQQYSGGQQSYQQNGGWNGNGNSGFGGGRFR